MVDTQEFSHGSSLTRSTSIIVKKDHKAFHGPRLLLVLNWLYKCHYFSAMLKLFSLFCIYWKLNRYLQSFVDTEESRPQEHQVDLKKVSVASSTPQCCSIVRNHLFIMVNCCLIFYEPGCVYMESAQSNGVRAPFGGQTNTTGRGQSFAHDGVQKINIVLNMWMWLCNYSIIYCYQKSGIEIC